MILEQACCHVSFLKMESQYSSPSQDGVPQGNIHPIGRCLCVLSIGLIKTMTKDNLGKERVYVHLQVIVHHAWKPGQELKQQPWRVLLTGLRSMACSGTFLVQHRNTFLGVAPPTVRLILLHQSLIRKISHRIAYEPTWWNYFLN